MENTKIRKLRYKGGSPMKSLANTINHSRQGKLSPRVPENDER
jgi:hypothetical protein